MGIKLQLIRSDLLVNKSALPEAIGNTRTYSLSWSPISFALGLEGFGGEFGSGFASRLRQAGLPESCITVLQEIWPKEFFAANSLQLVFTLRLENGQMRLALIQLFASAHRKLTTAPLSGQVALGVERNRRKVVAQMLGTESLWALFSIVWGLLSDRRVGLAEFRHGRGQFSGLFYKSLTHGVCTKLAQAEGRNLLFERLQAMAYRFSHHLKSKQELQDIYSVLRSPLPNRSRSREADFLPRIDALLEFAELYQRHCRSAEVNDVGVVPYCGPA